MSTTTDAYATCATITRREARNFYYGIRLLPPPKRDALCAVYALARRIDDIGDGVDGQAHKLQQLASVRAMLADPPAAADPVLVALADAHRHFAVPIEVFGELLDGVEMDVLGTRYATFEDLVPYCRAVAGSVGRLCLAVYGYDPARAVEAVRRADALGIALQQVNILRDIREDLLGGRVYLPADDLERFGIELRVGADGALVDPDGGLQALVREAAGRANAWFAHGLRLLPLLDRRSAACTGAMAGIYRDLLRRIDADPTVVFGGRLALSGPAKARVAARALAGLAP